MRHGCRFGLIATAVLGVITIGCAPAYQNGPLERADTRDGYRFETLSPGEGNTDETFICVTFSGGGVRAAALGYSVLSELRATPIPPLTSSGPAEGTKARTLLDELDVISSVSGGSFAAAGYALWRERFFDGRFEHGFLRRNIQLALISELLYLPNLFLLPSVVLDRIDVVAEYFHENLFERRTFGDLLRAGRRPFIVVNATNLAAGERFEFTQDDFDVLGSDLSSMPIGYAVAASQAVPLVFSPLRLKYYQNEASDQTLHRLLEKKVPREDLERRQSWAKGLLDPDEPEKLSIHAEDHRFLYLVDGALSDNLGLSYFIESYQDGLIRKRLESQGPDHIRRLVVIIVNAGTRPREDIESRESSPGILRLGIKTATISIENYSHALTNIVRTALQDEAQRTCRQYDECCEGFKECCPDGSPPRPPLEKSFVPYVIEVNFQDIENAEMRHELLELPTNYNLTQEQVDLVMRAGRRLLQKNADYQKLLEDLRAAR